MDVASLDKARQLMRMQKEGDRHLNIRPAFVLVPTALESVSNQVIKSVSVKGADINAGIINPVKDFATVIAEPRLDDASQSTFYLTAAKGSDTIEVAYLNGVDEPYIDQQEGFTVDGVTTKVRITAMQYADVAVRNAALERENERHKKTLSQQAKKPKTYHNDEAGRLLLQYSQQQAQTEGLIAAAKLSTTEKMTEAHKQLLSFQQRIADLSGKKLTADEKSVLAHKDEIALALQKLDISQQDLQHQNALNELKKKTLTLTSQLADEESRVRQQHALALATMGMGDQQRGRYEERLKIQQHYQEQLEQLKRDSKAKGTYGSDEYRQAEQELQASLDRRLAEWADYNAKVDAAQGDWTQGASRALDNFLAQGGNVAGMTENVFTNAFNGMADSIANFAVTGKGSFRSLTVSILADLAKMEARIAASKLLGSVLGMFGFGASAGGSTPSGAYSSAALSVIPNADGGVYRSAGLSQYSGSIVNRPTFFAFARGAAVMGEAGPEAILPLRRGTDGKLGVVAAGSGGMAMFAPQYHIAISNTGPELTPQALKAVYDLGKKAAADFVQQQGRDGGRLSGAYR